MNTDLVNIILGMKVRWLKKVASGKAAKLQGIRVTR